MPLLLPLLLLLPLPLLLLLLPLLPLLPKRVGARRRLDSTVDSNRLDSLRRSADRIFQCFDRKTRAAPDVKREIYHRKYVEKKGGGAHRPRAGGGSQGSGVRGEEGRARGTTGDSSDKCSRGMDGRIDVFEWMDGKDVCLQPEDRWRDILRVWLLDQSDKNRVI